jgi:succinate dehydrogenase / fumarate reductase cytochrome b subunit
MQTLGLSGKIWQKRMQCFGLIYVTLLMLGFTVVVLGFYFGCAPSLDCCPDGACCEAAAVCCQ